MHLCVNFSLSLTGRRQASKGKLWNLFKSKLCSQFPCCAQNVAIVVLMVCRRIKEEEVKVEVVVAVEIVAVEVVVAEEIVVAEEVVATNKG